MEMFNEEIQNTNTNYFIFDTGKAGHRDLDFNYYTWNKRRYNIVRPNDLFLYRKPQKVSSSGQFYFFGAGKITEIVEAKKTDAQFNQEGDQYAIIEKPCPFPNLVYQYDIKPSDLNDRRANPDSTWNHFFNQYDMTKIDRDDFIYILETGLGRQIIDNDETFGIITAHNQMNSQNYRVEDDFGNVKIRGAMQKKFSDEVKNNYNNKCAVTGISTRSLLIGSHIIPWSKDKDRRLDPSNGICLSSLVDKCFEEGLIVIDTDYRLRVSKNLDNDKELRLYLNKFNGKKINLPKNKDNYPNIDCLKYRINNFN